ncbi:hypothetical protein DXC51_12605 [Eisenbergiella massiliensis]|uniref:Uncharacterized protein n=1 Tax=Eisenbergiella massiliensis TaxID=1720294 RepID=A0A3E3I555_9FIRM|nr:hypothetical protein DXC51_12605 [Eisenbergiella massiliensis]
MFPELSFQGIRGRDSGKKKMEMNRAFSAPPAVYIPAGRAEKALVIFYVSLLLPQVYHLRITRAVYFFQCN